MQAIEQGCAAGTQEAQPCRISIAADAELEEELLLKSPTALVDDHPTWEADTVWANFPPIPSMYR
eukprot:5393265-Amphidinium_carterae.1